MIAQAKRFAASPYHAQYQVLLSDIYGADDVIAGTTWPCAGGNCANFVTFLDDVVGAIKASGVTVTYDLWNEPDTSEFWAPGVDTTQYFEMWDTADNTIKSLAPSAFTVGPDFAADPAQNATEWSEFLAHVKSAGTAPSEISDHLEGDGDDPVAVATSINSDLSTAGISARPLSANESLPENDQTAANRLVPGPLRPVRLRQRGPRQLVILLRQPVPGRDHRLQRQRGLLLHRPVVDFRGYADLTGSLVSTSGEVGNTAISAAEDSSHRRAVARSATPTATPAPRR